MWRAVLLTTGVLIVAGCTTSSGQSIQAANDAATMSSGWTVRCVDDQHLATKTCRAGKFGADQSPFQVYFVNGAGPQIMAGYSTYPGRDSTIRVGNGPVLTAAQPKQVVDALKGGGTAFVTYNVWPTGEKRTTVDVAGFSEAYAKLQTLL